MGKRILLVDDAAFMRKVCTEMLEKEGYEIAGEAVDGMQGYEKYKDLQPDLVLLDIAMPEHDGKWALQKIKGYDANANIVMLSAIGHGHAVIDSFILGARGFVVKPFQGDYLLDIVRGVFQNEYKPLNQVLLNHIRMTVPASSERILSQLTIDKILSAAQTTTQTDLAPFHDLITALESNTIGEKPDPVTDETPALLRQIIQGQEKMTALLERLVDEK